MTIKNTDERLEIIKRLLSQKNGIIDDEIKNEIFQITTQKRQEQSKNAAKDLVKAANGYDSEQVIRSLGSIEPPDIVKDQIRKTLSSILDPVRTTFMTEIPKYIDAISTEQNYKKDIPRAVKAASMKKIENGRFVSTVTGSAANGFMVNPEFKQLLATGYKPYRDSKAYQDNIANLSNLDINIGTPESDYIKNKNGDDLPDLENEIEKVPATRNKTAGLFIETFNNILDNTDFISNEAFKEISLEGSLLQDKEAKKLKAQTSTPDLPNWKISYKEKGSKYYLNIDNNYEYYLANVLTKNTSSYAFIGKLDKNFSNKTKKYIDDNLPECEAYNNDELYVKIMSKDTKGLFVDDNSDKQRNVALYLLNKYPQIVENFIQSFFSSYEKNRLLKPFKIPPIPGLDPEDINKATNLVILNLINFIPEVSQELIDCEKQPHPLNLDQIVDLMSKKFAQVGIQIIPQKECHDDSPTNTGNNATVETTSMATSLLLIRLCVLENILKGLFVFDEHQYDLNILDGELLVDFIFVKVLESLESMNILPQIEQIVEDNYDFFKTNGVIKEIDENTDTKIESISINKTRVNDNTNELKALIKSLTRKTLGYFKNLIGTEENNNSNATNNTEMLSRISNNVIYDIVGDQTLNFNKLHNESKYSKRFADTNADNFFILEKYIDVGEIFYKDNATTKTTQFLKIAGKYDHIKGCVNLDTYQQFLNDFIKVEINQQRIPTFGIFNPSTLGILKHVMKIPKISTRLVQVFSKDNTQRTELDRELSANSIAARTGINEGVDVYNNNIHTKLKNFYVGAQQSYEIKQEKIKQKKMYGFYNIDINTKLINYYNSLLVCEQQKDLPFEELINIDIVNDIKQVYENNKQLLLNRIIQSAEYEILINKSLFLDKLPNLALIYSNCALSNSQMEHLFDGSKKRILDIYDAAININNYKYKNSTDKMGGISKKYQTDMMNIGNPNGGANFDVLQFFITTPILILKGLCQVMDPNISIASQIVNAAAAGLLFPKIDVNTQEVSYPGESVILPTVLASLALLPVNIFLPTLGPLAIGPPVTPLPGMLFWVLEPLLWKLPFFQNQAANSDAAKKLKDDPDNKGLNIGGAGKFNCLTDQDE